MRRLGEQAIRRALEDAKPAIIDALTNQILYGVGALRVDKDGITVSVPVDELLKGVSK